MKIPSWGAFKGAYNGTGIYWAGTYNAEGEGSFRTLAECRAWIDARRAEWERIENARKLELIAAGKAIRGERIGDMVRVHAPDGLKEIPIRVYRQNIFDWETKWGMGVVFVVDAPFVAAQFDADIAESDC